jgi:hypothetical protein
MPTVTRVVFPVFRSRRNTSEQVNVSPLHPFVSPATRFDAYEKKTTKRPSALMDGASL